MPVPTSVALSAVLLLIVGSVGIVALYRVRSWRRDLPVVAAVAVAAAVWSAVSRPVEGPVLLEVTRRHGVTAADLLAVPALIVGGVLVARLLLAVRCPRR